MCGGAPQAQKDVANQQSSFFKTAQDQAGQVFGNSSKVFNDLMTSYAPIVAAGPGQQGFSAPELAARNASAIETTGRAYKNAAAATGNALSAVGGGNLAVAGGSEIGREMGVANAGAAQTSSELNNIQQENYATGRKNYFEAAQGLAGAPSTFNAATGMMGAANTAGEAASKSQNEVASESSSPWKLLSGALGGLAGNALGGIGKGIGGKLGGMINPQDSNA
jgi:hypothetical protein